jgi:hypothetical protein
MGEQWELSQLSLPNIFFLAYAYVIRKFKVLDIVLI